MANIIDLPKIYYYNEKIFDSDMKVTKRVTSGLENVLYAYTFYVPNYAKAHDNNAKNFVIEKAYLIGSGVRENRVDSDLDIMLIAPQLDSKSETDIKLWLNVIFYNNKPKIEAVDAWVRPKDKFPERSSYEITNQVKKLLKTYNSKLDPRSNRR